MPCKNENVILLFFKFLLTCKGSIIFDTLRITQNLIGYWSKYSKSVPDNKALQLPVSELVFQIKSNGYEYHRPPQIHVFVSVFIHMPIL